MNRDFITELLCPKNHLTSKSKVLWEDFLNKVDDNISWYPSAGLDFRDIAFLENSELNQTGIKPSCYIHTDYQIFHQLLYPCEGYEDLMGLNVNISDVLDIGQNNLRAYLLRVSIESSDNLYNSFVLYFFNYNEVFIENMIIQNRIKLSHIFCHDSQSFNIDLLRSLVKNHKCVDYFVSNLKSLSDNNFQIGTTYYNFLKCIDKTTNQQFNGDIWTFKIIQD